MLMLNESEDAGLEKVAEFGGVSIRLALRLAARSLACD
jgi:hypothetical protein